VVAVGGTNGTSVVWLTLDTASDATDGLYGRAMNGTTPLPMEDVTNVAGAGKTACDGTALWHLAEPPNALGDPMAATRIGDAPGITALAYASNVGLFGGNGLTIQQITLSPYGIQTLGTLSVAGCTGILDFTVADAGGGAGQPYFTVLVDCAGGDKVMTATYSAGTGLVTNTPPGMAGATDLRGYDFSAFASSATTLYRYQAGAFSTVRPLSPCVGAVRGID
jgi:hypothetical protein